MNTQLWLPVLSRTRPAFIQQARRPFSTCHVCASGSNKWSKIKHKKAANDAAKGASYGTISREIISSIKQYIANAPTSSTTPSSPSQAFDPLHNVRLGMLVKKAKDLGFPKDKIEATLAKAAGKGEEQLQHVTYEALGPTSESGHTVAMIIECSTDSTARTHSKVREAFNKVGGRLSSTSHLFDRIGFVRVSSRAESAAATNGGAASFEEVFEQAVELGAEDVGAVDEADLTAEELEEMQKMKAKGVRTEMIQIQCPPTEVKPIADRMRQMGLSVVEAETRLVPNGALLHAAAPAEEEAEGDSEYQAWKETVEKDEQFGGWVEEEYMAKMDKMLGMLEENADCTRIWTNLSDWPPKA